MIEIRFLKAAKKCSYCIIFLTLLRESKNLETKSKQNLSFKKSLRSIHTCIHKIKDEWKTRMEK